LDDNIEKQKSKAKGKTQKLPGRRTGPTQRYRSKSKGKSKDPGATKAKARTKTDRLKSVPQKGELD
jgi:hypothetical protein